MANVYQDKLDRLFAKYRHSPNILKVLEILADPTQDTRDVEDWFLSNLSIDDGEGVFLDFFGELIGIIRPPLQEPDVFWLCEDWEVADDPDNHYGLATDALTEGGYLTGDAGILHQTAPGGADDDTYREFIRSKAATFRLKATREVLFNYLKFFGCRWKIVEGVRSVELEPCDYDLVNYYVRNYIETLGFRPAGIQVTIKQQTTPSADV